MSEFSIAHLLVIAVVVIVLFGRGKISSIMGEFGRGISAFKQGFRDSAENSPAVLPGPVAVEPSPEPTRQG